MLQNIITPDNATVLAIWMLTSAIVFSIVLLIGKFAIGRTAAKRKQLFSLSLLLTASLPLFALAILLIANSNVGIKRGLSKLNNVLVDSKARSNAPAKQPFYAELVAINPNSEHERFKGTLVPVEEMLPAEALVPMVPIAKGVPVVSATKTNDTGETHRQSSWIARVLIIGWGTGVIAMLLRLAGGIWKSRRHLSRCWILNEQNVGGKRNAFKQLLSYAKSSASRHGLNATPEILISPAKVSPSVVGPIQQRIVISEQALETFNDHELRLVLDHEMSHIKRNDLRLNFLLQCSLAVHWLNPLAYLVFKQVRISQEELCDNEVAQVNDRFEYARLLLKTNQMFSVSISQCALAMAAGHSPLGDRVDWVLDETRDGNISTSRRWKLITVISALTLGMSFGTIAAALQTHAQFAPNTELDSNAAAGGVAQEKDQEKRTPTKNNKTQTDELEKTALRLLQDWHVDNNIKKLGWEHLPYLIKQIENEAPIDRVPVNWASSQRQTHCTIGTAAMWFIDMLCCNNLYPGLNPTLSRHQVKGAEANRRAVESFKTWWKIVKDWPASEAKRVNPLSFTDVTWYGNRPRPPYTHSPAMALTNFVHYKRVVSVSPSGNYVFITQSKDGKTTGTMNKITQKGLSKVWTIKEFKATTVFALDSGLLLKTTNFRDFQSKRQNADLEFIQNGKVIKSLELSKLAGSRIKLVPFNLDLEMRRGNFWVNAKFTAGQTIQQKTFRFDQASGEMLQVITVDPKKSVSNRRRIKLHTDNAIEKLVTYDIVESVKNKQLLEIPILSVVPAGQSKTRAEVFKALGLSENQLIRFRTETRRNVQFLTWQISPSYDICCMSANNSPDNRGIKPNDPRRKVYGIRLLPTARK